MRITDRYQSTIDRVSKATAPSATQKTKPAAVPAESPNVNASISAEASQKSAEVESLKARIADGSFKVDADAIANKLVGIE
jgi:anti-sigma28 factor (negative regulator of flagellin synthesis)